ncbi:radical SAM family heme chaperone HemW [Ferrimonas sp. SCSIO 43195]|uniref:radical SAM family heme chaperone HemW n=1 Tax=Ferrimonas sp. SCSIO 43195 TaxID=2822844 RepID=UPI002074C0A6|nr:radical SAM family heme chaperone HemW [Ferrimonas sp. SCSIO 43195]USD38185.1 radical SAM family heme chaperone HemW [Ferrimonas sp. SCSIO 43195]
MMQLPPLSLYVHIPWCEQKCPYCDFNSHGRKGPIPQQQYIDALLEDLEGDLDGVQGRQLHSIFIGGGTPSLIDSDQIARLLEGVQNRVGFGADTEITMEANPGTLEAGRFEGYRRAGVNRLSIGVQSFQPQKLLRLGRIHDDKQAHAAIEAATSAGFERINIDLMHGLPQQSTEDALFDLKQAIAHNTVHLSWYQLTIEPNTQFASKPPTLPDEEVQWQIFEQGRQLLLDAGYQQYEISAWAKPGYRCDHNLNYWRFGDYLGIGCGAHGKLSLPAERRIMRTTKVRHPKGYLDPERRYLDSDTNVARDDMALEYYMNRLRLMEPMPLAELSQRTLLTQAQVIDTLSAAQAKGLISIDERQMQLTTLGHRYLNELLGMFLPE